MTTLPINQDGDQWQTFIIFHSFEYKE
ncbi:uncharacterized protein METZ01_LOCUS144712 [marine metagenome]|uniref:Uncharacterized protein n=1 Tax=marine metagenome TaxID=408172 RepID=A0A381ZRE6_9ZZZZ